KSTDYLSFYATRFDAVELDNTFYATPAQSTVKSWYAKTPPGFLFAAKVPQVVTRSEEHTSELQSRFDLVCRLLLEKKNAQNRRLGQNLSLCHPIVKERDEVVEADNVQRASEIVAERHQAPFAADLVEAADQEVAIAGAAFERAEWMFDQAGALAHQCAGILHPFLVTIDHRFVLPAVDRALVRLWTEASLAQVTSLEDGFEAHIADVLPASRADFDTVHRFQQRARWTAINVGFGVIAERFMAEAA